MTDSVAPESTSLPIDEPELDRMLSALVDGMLGEQDRARLEALLLDDAAARRRYLEHMQLEYLLASEIGYDAGRSRPVVKCAPASGDRTFFLGGAAAAILVAIAAWTAPALSSGTTKNQPAARVTAVQDAVWEGQKQPTLGRPVGSGPVRLAHGSAQITFASGAVVAVHAPASVEVLGGNRMFLRSGRVTPFVPPSAKGFTVVSPGGEVVDFGTEFSIGVGADGKTDVFVIDGEVAVAGGYDEAAKPKRLTQGFASRFAAGEQDPKVTLRPLVIDHFDSQDGPVLRRDWDENTTSVVGDGKLWVPIDGRPHRPDSSTFTAIENDFTSLVGTRSVISFKAALPDSGNVHPGRWVALVIDGAEGKPPKAFDPDASLGIMVSPAWRVGMRAAGEVVYGLPSEAFRRSQDITGPYQVVLVIDDSPEAHAEHGHAVVTAMVNGLEFIRDYPISLPSRPRLAFQTFVRPNEGGAGYATIDDFSVSIDAPQADLASSN